MGYITFLDLLGTKDFCGSREIYNNNISIFYKEAQTHSRYLNGAGKVGIFSDCLYAESNNLKQILDFLVALRKRLCARKLFFNAALTKGKIDIVDPAKSKYENFFGVAFVESDIADVYLKQNQFKGIGIWVDESLHDEISKISGYRLIRSGYLKEVDTSTFEPYYDIAFKFENKVFDQYEDAVVKTIFNECLLAYTKSKRYGRYYLSILATLINSYSNYNLSWNSAKCNFEKCPMIYYIIMKLAEDNGRSYPYIQGLEMLCLLIVDNAFEHEEVTDIDQSQIVEKFMSYECLKKPYSYSINSLPDVFCSKKNRDKFIRIYQENIVSTQVNNLFKDSKEVCD